MNRTWVAKKNPVKIERPINVGSCHLISGLSSEGETFTVIRTEGANSRLEFLNYLILLDRKLMEIRDGRSFKEKLILVFDNAPIHKSIEIRDFLAKRGYMAITVPRYTPDFNPVEKLFAVLKQRFV